MRSQMGGRAPRASGVSDEVDSADLDAMLEAFAATPADWASGIAMFRFEKILSKFVAKPGTATGITGGTRHFIRTTSQRRYRQCALARRRHKQTNPTTANRTAICQLCSQRRWRIRLVILKSFF